MPFPFQIDILGMILKGVLIGIIASAPMGPVGVLCIQRTLNKGRWYGFVTGIGAAMSDIIYAMLTGFGMSFIMDLITNPTNKFWLQISGSAILLYLLFQGQPNPQHPPGRHQERVSDTQCHHGFLRNPFQSSYHIPFHGYICPVCLRYPQPPIRNVIGLYQHCDWSPDMVVWTVLAHQQDKRKVRRQWYSYN